MAGKSNKGRSKRGTHTASSVVEPSVQSNVPANDNVEGTPEAAKDDVPAIVAASDGATSANSEVKENETANEGSQPKQGESG